MIKRKFWEVEVHTELHAVVERMRLATTSSFPSIQGFTKGLS